LFLDTRTKIVLLHDLPERLQNRAAAWISGHFDPLLAEHVQRLARARQPGRLLVVEVTNPAQPLLSQRARAELVAALSMVDCVVLGDGEAGREAVDGGITERFIEHVLQRHAQESPRPKP
jgi:bifunctional ADP-heptose synthase (sugar kinase/adenylyltransferase)